MRTLKKNITQKTKINKQTRRLINFKKLKSSFTSLERSEFRRRDQKDPSFTEYPERSKNGREIVRAILLGFKVLFKDG